MRGNGYGGWRTALTTIAWILCLAWTSAIGAADAEVDPEALRPGLVTTYRDRAGSAPVEITRLEPTIALAWKAGETAHPRLAADAGTVRWEGYLNVLRAGAYRFHVRLRGEFRLALDGKEVLSAAVAEDAAAFKDGGEVRLEAGVHRLTAEFTRLPGTARVELYWQSGHFYREPLPYDHLGHLPGKAPGALDLSQKAEHGRFLAEEASCVRCHQADEKDRVARGLLARQGPDLSRVGERARVRWIYDWLEAPAKVRPGAVMPRLFANDRAGQVERYAVARYLAALGGPLRPDVRKPSAKESRNSVARGEALFSSVGCIVCHGTGKANDSTPGQSLFYGFGGLTPARATFPLGDLASKTNTERLASYLADPLAVDPSGRMPHMLLQAEEARDLARFLCQQTAGPGERELPEAPKKEAMLAAFRRVEPRAGEAATFQQLPADAQWQDLGKRLVIHKSCNSCHTIEPGGRAFASVAAGASFRDIQDRTRQQQGCLAEQADKAGTAPRFGFTVKERASLRQFLQAGTSGAGSPAPSHAARVALKRFNCLACHGRDGEGGLTSELIENLRQFEKADNAEAVSPPPLTGVAHKLRAPWLRQVLTQGGRARPWMGLRMPQFGEAHVGRLPEAFAAMEGTESEEQVHQVPVTPAKSEAGRLLVGKNAFGCISCHDIAGIANHGTRGPDLVQMNQRVRYEWYRRWLEQPQRMQPGTRMPGLFLNGKSTQETILEGAADQQAEAIWAYLSLGPNLPLPFGLEPPKGLVLTVTDRPLLLRTFMPDAGSRAVAVGYPTGLALAFDAAQCRLAYAWSGNFLDASPVWNERGGAPARVLGARFWTAPTGFPWGMTTTGEPPDFAAQARSPAFGASMPEGQLFKGQPALHFNGYNLDGAGAPTFRYHYRVNDAVTIEVSERPEPLRSTAGVGIARHFILQVPAGAQTLWLRAGETTGAPRLLDARGQELAFDLKKSSQGLPPEARLLVLPQEKGRPVALELNGAPDGSHWHLHRQGASWQALLETPPTKAAARVTFKVTLWVPYRDEPGAIKDLLTAR